MVPRIQLIISQHWLRYWFSAEQWGLVIYVSQDWVIFGSVNTLKLRKNGRHFPDDAFKGIFFDENVEDG